MNYDLYIRDCIKESIKTKSGLFSKIKEIQTIVDSIVNCYHHDGKILICGNGGSAADSQHFATELVNEYKIRGRPALSALALSMDIVQSTAWANDHGNSAEFGFARQVEAYAKSGDILLGISTSGNAGNVYRAFEKGKQRGTVNIALTGKGGGKIKSLADLCFEVPSNDTPRVQEAHELTYHIICDLVEKELFGPGY